MQYVTLRKNLACGSLVDASPYSSVKTFSLIIKTSSYKPKYWSNVKVVDNPDALYSWSYFYGRSEKIK
jgi:hypothetical protein